MPSSRRIVELDGIRGLAIALVVAFHYLAPIGAPNHRWWQMATTVMSTFWAGVDLFFVLSGFLIGGILMDSAGSPRYFQTFYLRRIHRIFPVYFIWLALGLIGVWMQADRWVGPGTFSGAGAAPAVPIWWYVLFLQNNANLLLGVELPLWMAMSWSLAVEEQFYLILPAVVRVMKRWWLVVLAMGVVLVSPLVRWRMMAQGVEELAMSFATVSRLDGLAMGVLVAVIVRHEPSRRWVGQRFAWLLAVMLGGLAGFALMTLVPEMLRPELRFTVVSILFASLLLTTLTWPDWRFGRWMRQPVFQYLGRISYTLYVVHQGVRALVTAAATAWLPGGSWRIIVITGVSLAVSLAVAEVSWRWMERRLIQRAHVLYRY